MLPDPPILVITDRRMASRPLVDVIAAALRGGCRWVLLREPDLTSGARVDLGRDIEALCKRHRALLSISADVAAADAVGAGGVHLPQRAADAEIIARARAALGKSTLIGISCHSLGEAQAAQELGADYVTLSPLFLTESKPGYGPALGTDRLSTMVAALRLPVLALGGIGPDNAAEVRASGVAGIAVMGIIMRAADPEAMFAGLHHAWRG